MNARRAAGRMYAVVHPRSFQDDALNTSTDVPTMVPAIRVEFQQKNASIMQYNLYKCSPLC